MKNIIYAALLFIGFISCKEHPKKELYSTETQKDTSYLELPAPQESDADPKPKFLFYTFDNEDYIIESGFVVSDTDRYVVGTFYLPVINHPEKIKLALVNKKVLIDDFNRFKLFFSKEDAKYSKQEKERINEYSAKPIYIKQYGDWFSVVYNIYNYGGGAHHTNDYLTINYNTKINTNYNFDNYFKIKSVSDTNEFVGIINGYLKQEEHFGLANFSLPIDILIEQDSVVFNFYSYQIGAYTQGEPHLRISKKALEKFIRK